MTKARTILLSAILLVLLVIAVAVGYLAMDRHAANARADLQRRIDAQSAVVAQLEQDLAKYPQRAAAARDEVERVKREPVPLVSVDASAFAAMTDAQRNEVARRNAAGNPDGKAEHERRVKDAEDYLAGLVAGRPSLEPKLEAARQRLAELQQQLDKAR
jgi:uncharacterized membrane-anchored protein YhcB (DUF1043 family)